MHPNVSFHQYSLYAERRDKHLEIKFYDGNQIDVKTVLVLGGGFLCNHSSFVC